MCSVQNTKGYTILEMVIAVSILSLVTIGVMSISVSSSKLVSEVTSKTYADSDASLAMQFLLNDIREGQAYAISTTLQTNDTLSLTFPVITSSGAYNRTVPDASHPATYYLSDSSGVLGRTGTYLWKSKAGNNTLIRKNIKSISFVGDTTRSIKVSVTSAPNWLYYSKANNATPSTLQNRDAFLRNF